MTVLENLQMGAYLRTDAAGIRDDVERMYALFPILGDRRATRAGALSGGEQQMCAIARGLMSRPGILLLDEPSLGLSPILVEQIFGIIRTINAEGTTVLLVEQNAHMALGVAAPRLCDRDGRDHADRNRRRPAGQRHGEKTLPRRGVRWVSGRGSVRVIGAVGVDAPVAQEGPVAARLLLEGGVALGEDRLLAVVRWPLPAPRRRGRR